MAALSGNDSCTIQTPPSPWVQDAYKGWKWIKCLFHHVVIGVGALHGVALLHGIAIFNVGPFHGAAAARREDKKTSLDMLAGGIIVRLSGEETRSDPSQTTTYTLEVVRFLKFRNSESRCLLHVHEMRNWEQENDSFTISLILIPVPIPPKYFMEPELRFLGIGIVPPLIRIRSHL